MDTNENSKAPISNDDEIIHLKGVHPDLWLTPEGRKTAHEILSRNWDKLLRGHQEEDADETWGTLQPALPSRSADTSQQCSGS